MTFYKKLEIAFVLRKKIVYLQKKKFPKERHSISIMTKKQALQLFEQRKVRTVWDDEQEKWYFSIVDVCEVLTDSKDALTARKYWNKLKQRLKEEGNETVTNCHQFKLRAADGKMRLTDVARPRQNPLSNGWHKSPAIG